MYICCASISIARRELVRLINCIIGYAKQMSDKNRLSCEIAGQVCKVDQVAYDYDRYCTFI